MLAHSATFSFTTDTTIMNNEVLSLQKSDAVGPESAQKIEEIEAGSGYSVTCTGNSCISWSC